MMKNKWVFILAVLLLVMLHGEYLTTLSYSAGRSDLTSADKNHNGDTKTMHTSDAISGNVRNEAGAPLAGSSISLFDGFSMRDSECDNNGNFLISQIPVSPGLNAVLFITKEGYLPSIINVARSDKDEIYYPVTLKRSPADGNGYIAGAVYQPVKGGKIRYQSGINRFLKDKRVWLEQSGIITEVKSNQDGHFIISVPAGKYLLQAEGSREKAAVEVNEGKTTIRNMRAGIVLVD